MKHFTTVIIEKVSRVPVLSKSYREGSLYYMEGFVVVEGENQRKHRVSIGVGEGGLGELKRVRDLIRIGGSAKAFLSWEPSSWTIFRDTTKTIGKLVRLEFAY